MRNAAPMSVDIYHIRKGNISLVWQISLLGILLIVGTGLRIYHLAEYSLWTDEAHSWWLANLNNSNFFNAIRILGVHPPFYFGLLKSILLVSNENEIGLRTLSVLAGSASIILAMLIGMQVGGVAGSLAAGWFWAFNPFVIWYSQEARPYALTVFFCLIVTSCYLALSKRSLNILWVITVIALSAGLLTHYYFFATLLVLVLASITQIRNNPRFFRSWTIATIFSLLPVLVWLVWFFMQPNPTLGIGWILQPKLADILWTIWNLLSGYAGELSYASIIFGSLAAILAVIGLVYFSRYRKELFFMSILWLFAILAIWVISIRRPIYMDRYFIVLLPFVVIMISGGGEQLYFWTSSRRNNYKHNSSLIVLPLLMIAIGIWSGYQVHLADTFNREDWKGMMGYLLSSSQAPILFSDPETEVAFQYYNDGQMESDIIKQTNLSSDYWWVLRQPYTMVHAFAQGMSDPNRPWKPEVPDGCQLMDRWESSSGVAAWKIHCD